MLDRVFLDHPHSVDESYGEHLVAAGGFGVAMVAGGLACLAHALVPALFERTGSRIIGRLHGRMVTNRVRQSADRRPHAGWDPAACI